MSSAFRWKELLYRHHHHRHEIKSDKKINFGSKLLFENARWWQKCSALFVAFELLSELDWIIGIFDEPRKAKLFLCSAPIPSLYKYFCQCHFTRFSSGWAVLITLRELPSQWQNWSNDCRNFCRLMILIFMSFCNTWVLCQIQSPSTKGYQDLRRQWFFHGWGHKRKRMWNVTLKI